MVFRLILFPLAKERFDSVRKKEEKHRPQKTVIYEAIKTLGLRAPQMNESEINLFGRFTKSIKAKWKCTENDLNNDSILRSLFCKVISGRFVRFAIIHDLWVLWFLFNLLGRFFIDF